MKSKWDDTEEEGEESDKRCVPTCSDCIQHTLRHCVPTLSLQHTLFVNRLCV